MKVSILGMGAFGIALTKILKKDVEVSMWTNFEDELKAVELKRENTVVLPNVKIDKKVELTTDLEKCVKDSSVIFMAVPAVAVREVANKLKDLYEKDKDGLKDYTKVLYSQARLIEGLPIENPTEISNLVCNLISK